MTQTIEQLTARVRELEKENARLIREVVNRNQRALDGDKAVKAADALYEQLAKAEQRVAEACALQVATETKFHRLDAARVAKEIRSGEWRKFVKEM